MLQKSPRWMLAVIFLLLIGCAEQSGSVNNTGPEKSIRSFTSSDNNSDAVGSRNIPASASPGSFDQAIYDSLGATEFSYGGLNYDTWYVAASGATKPTSNHPLWTGTSPDLANEATWRCKQCHGWDYQGKDGIYGLDPADKNFSGICGILPTANCTNTSTTETEIWTFLHDGGTTPGIDNPADHAFSDILSDDELYALTKFVMMVRAEAAIGDAPMDRIVSDPDAKMYRMPMVNTSQSNGLKLYNSPSESGGCNEACHGEDGKLIDVDPPNNVFIKKYSMDNPWEVLHKIRFGVPGSDPKMPGIVKYDNPLFDLQGAIDLLAYTQMGISRSNIVGGRLYDDWIVETGADVTQAFPNPLLKIAPDQAAAGAISDVDGWRCSQCHGYNFEGGVFGFDNNLVDLKEVNSWTIGYVFDVLKNGYQAIDPETGEIMKVHKYAGILNRPGLWNLAEFAVEKIFDTRTIIRAPTGGIREPQATAVNGEMFYNGNNPVSFPDGTVLDCVTCHGSDGKLAAKPAGSSTDIFMMSWSEPWKFFHQVKFGTPRLPGTTDVMPGMLEAVRDDGHPTDNHDVADVHLFSQQYLNSVAPTEVVNIKRTRIENPRL